MNITITEGLVYTIIISLIIATIVGILFETLYMPPNKPYHFFFKLHFKRFKLFIEDDLLNEILNSKKDIHIVKPIYCLLDDNTKKIIYPIICYNYKSEKYYLKYYDEKNNLLTKNNIIKYKNIT